MAILVNSPISHQISLFDPTFSFIEVPNEPVNVNYRGSSACYPLSSFNSLSDEQNKVSSDHYVPLKCLNDL